MLRGASDVVFHTHVLVHIGSAVVSQLISDLFHRCSWCAYKRRNIRILTIPVTCTFDVFSKILDDVTVSDSSCELTGRYVRELAAKIA